MPDGMVLAVGLDSADAVLFRELVDKGELPALARLEQEGGWVRVRSPARIGSGAPWPTFYSGIRPEEHGAYSTWRWQPDRMATTPEHQWRIQPFWEADDLGLTVGALDVPTARPTGTRGGFTISEWGPHDPVSGRIDAMPPEIEAELTERHPFRWVQDDDPDRPIETETLVSAAVTGAELRARLGRRLIERHRPDLAIVVFSEIHHSSHELWHTVVDDPLYEHLGDEPRSLIEVFHAVDRALGDLIDTVPADTPVAAFSLHGMRPSRGLVRPLHPILTALGYTAAPSGRSASAQARTALARLKRSLPPGVKRLYHRRAPVRMRLRTAQPTMMPPIDWSRTRAFSLVSADQLGDLRVNLRGREAAGIVDPGDYEPLLDELTARLESIQREDGEPLVKEIVRIGDGSPPEILPDLVVHWTDAAYADPVRVRGLDVEYRPGVLRITGQHRAEGFLVGRGFDLPESGELDPIELQDLLVSRTRA